MDSVEVNFNEKEPKDNCCLSFSVFCTVTTGLTLQTMALVNIFGNLCDIVPKTRDYCEKHKTEDNHTVDSPEVLTYNVLCFLNVGNTFAHLTAFFLACSLIFTCAKICCVPVCGCIYRCLVSAGHTWYILIAVGGFCNLAGSVALPIVVPVEDVINIYGYQLALGSLGFDIITVAAWIAFMKCHGAPDRRYFLGSSRKIADYEINVTKSRTDTTYTHASGHTETRKGIPMNNYSLKRIRY